MLLGLKILTNARTTCNLYDTFRPVHLDVFMGAFMKIIVGVWGSLFAVVSTGVLLYVSMTTGLGPWMAPTLVLVGGIVLRFFSSATAQARQHDLVIVQAIGSTGGAIATAVGFSLPTFYFLQPHLFQKMLEHPGTFSTLLGMLVLVAGWWGIWVARLQAPRLLRNESLRFPVSSAIYDTIVSQSQKAAAWLLGSGAAAAGIIGFLRDGFGRVAPVVSRTWYVGSGFLGTALPLELLPVGWAIGFLAGLPIVLPLLVGMVSKYAIAWPLNAHSQFLPFSLFEPLSTLDFSFAFCSGIILSQTIESFLAVPQQLSQSFRKYWDRWTGNDWTTEVKKWVRAGAIDESVPLEAGRLYSFLCRNEWLIVIGASVAALTYLSFPFLAQVMLLVLSFLFIQHLNRFACRTGLGSYGRYMTFTMVPIMLSTAVTQWHITLLCVFVGIAGSASVDMLFSYKVATTVGMQTSRIHRAQLLGVLVTAASIGILFWVLCTHFELGSAPLIAHRSRARALLLHSFHFHWIVLCLGGLYGMLLKRLGINPVLAFGGLIMPNAITIALSLGALIRALTRHAKTYTPFWSGVFAGDALWVLLTLTKL